MSIPVSGVSQKKLQETDDVRVLMGYIKLLQNDIIRLQKDLEAVSAAVSSRNQSTTITT